MNEPEILEQVVTFVVANFLYMRRNKELRDDDSLLRNGVITSLGVMELVDWVEETFGVQVDPTEITEQNFETPRAIARFIHAKTAAMAAA
ncbi:MAG: acyl carrier protein [Gemmatimonadales bacterium]